MMDKPLSYYVFEMLYWCGIWVGELLASSRWTSTLKRRQPRYVGEIYYGIIRFWKEESGRKAGFHLRLQGTGTKPQINQDAVRLVKQLYGIDMEQTQYSKTIDRYQLLILQPLWG